MISKFTEQQHHSHKKDHFQLSTQDAERKLFEQKTGRQEHIQTLSRLANVSENQHSSYKIQKATSQFVQINDKQQDDILFQSSNNQRTKDIKQQEMSQYNREIQSTNSYLGTNSQPSSTNSASRIKNTQGVTILQENNQINKQACSINSSKESQRFVCSKCKVKQSNQIVLQCGHILCLSCLNLSHHANQTPTSFTVCCLCNQYTILDRKQKQGNQPPPYESSITQNHQPYIKSIPLALQVQQQKIYIEPQASLNQIQNDKNILQQSNSPQLYNQIQQDVQTNALRPLCQKHQSEEAKYFCWTCECQCICGICVESPTSQHRNHNISLIQGRCLELQGRLNEIFNEISSKVTEMEAQENVFERNISNLRDLAEKSTLEMKQLCSRIREEIDKKEKQLANDLLDMKEQITNKLENSRNKTSEERKTLLTLAKKLGMLQQPQCYNTTDSTESIIAFNYFAECTRILQQMFSKDNQVIEFDDQKFTEDYLKLIAPFEATLEFLLSSNASKQSDTLLHPHIKSLSLPFLQSSQSQQQSSSTHNQNKGSTKKATNAQIIYHKQKEESIKKKMKPTENPASQNEHHQTSLSSSKNKLQHSSESKHKTEESQTTTNEQSQQQKMSSNNVTPLMRDLTTDLIAAFQKKNQIKAERTHQAFKHTYEDLKQATKTERQQLPAQEQQQYQSSLNYNSTASSLKTNDNSSDLSKIQLKQSQSSSSFSQQLPTSSFSNMKKPSNLSSDNFQRIFPGLAQQIKSPHFTSIHSQSSSVNELAKHSLLSEQIPSSSKLPYSISANRALEFTIEQRPDRQKRLSDDFKLSSMRCHTEPAVSSSIKNTFSSTILPVQGSLMGLSGKKEHKYSQSQIMNELSAFQEAIKSSSIFEKEMRKQEAEWEKKDFSSSRSPMKKSPVNNVQPQSIISTSLNNIQALKTQYKLSQQNGRAVSQIAINNANPFFLKQTQKEGNASISALKCRSPTPTDCPVSPPKSSSSANYFTKDYIDAKSSKPHYLYQHKKTNLDSAHENDVSNSMNKRLNKPKSLTSRNLMTMFDKSPTNDFFFRDFRQNSTNTTTATSGQERFSVAPFI